MSLTLGRIARFMTHGLYALVNTRHSCMISCTCNFTSGPNGTTILAVQPDYMTGVDTYNKQVPQLNSSFLSPGSKAVDAFTCNWGNELTGGALQSTLLTSLYAEHARKTNAHGILIVLCWPSAPFWMVLFPDGKNLASFVQNIVELPQREGCSYCNHQVWYCRCAQYQSFS